MNNKYLIITLLSVTIGFGSAMANNAVPAKSHPTQVLQRIIVPGTHYEVGMGLGKMAPNTMKN